MQARDKPVILFIAEAVTLAHFARIVTLAKALDPTAYEVIVASDPRYTDLDAPLSCAFYPLRSIPSAEFAQALAQGKPLYDVEKLTRYVEEDLALIKHFKPDLIVGDFRLSLAVSAPLTGVPYAAVVNAYWSPYADIAYPIPDLPMTRFLGVRFAQRLFDAARPIAFALHARPLNQVRRRYNLPPLGHDLRTAYTWGDYTLYADVPELVPTQPVPANHRYLGPPLWSARAPLPNWWGHLPEDKPVALLTLGSSGTADLLPMAVSALSELPITVITATAGKIDLPDVPANAFVADYLPLDVATRRASLVICNGGSLTTYQALASGTPILGICSNMDQLLNMSAIERLGAGLSMRAARVRPAQLKEAVRTLLEIPTFTHAAEQAGERFRQFDAGQRFRAFISEVLG
ncbi:glycosyltransferase [Candidatus Nitrotoga sp. 1052]|uniref:glycosyltransferase n=1 Tax=Candidatus Nitrotoga sp. 1052 TaxID=2886964 RepID=UPI001EF3F7C0|nr:glycosyltransferase [Candidatus Nitrotoga sp. 1052]CAH1084881.1 PGL/p-HBAD biosynthesis rhamnosyltransferase [Candidatus Nitrotoga sp. 1052]